MRASFVLSEIGIGLRRNLTMTIAVVLTVSISLAMFGAALLIRKQVSAMKDYWYDKVEVSVFLCGESRESANCNGTKISQEQRDQLQRDLQATPLVAEIFYESQQDAYKRFSEQFKDSPELVRNVSPDALPESFRVKLKDPTKFDVVASAFQDHPGVEEVQDQRALLEPFFRLLRLLQMGTLLVAGFQLIAALLLVYNTIRVAAFSRRRETGIMRLVGASNLYIQLPFLLEGVLAGLVGALIASGGIVALKTVVIDRMLKSDFPIAYVGWDAVLGVIPLLFLTGMVLSGVASFITLRRHLRV